MRFRTALLASAIGLSSVVGPALADPPLGSRLGDRQTKDPEKRERESALGAQEMARCLVNKQTSVVRGYLAALDPAESKRLDHKMDGEHECFSMSEGNDLVEGRMVKKDEPMFASLAVLPRQLTYSRPWYALSGRNSSVDEMATCVSEIAPRESLALLKTTPYGADEGAAFGTLGPSLVSCLQAGYKVTGNRQSLRAAISDALYQRVANPPAAVAPKP